MVLSYISALFGVLRKIVPSVPGYEKDKITFLKVMTNISLPSEGKNPGVAYV